MSIMSKKKLTNFYCRQTSSGSSTLVDSFGSHGQTAPILSVEETETEDFAAITE